MSEIASKRRSSSLRRLRSRLAAQEFDVLALVLTAAAILYAFVQLADEVVEGDTRFIDSTVLLWLRNSADLTDPLGPAWLELAARDITSLGGYPMVILTTLCAIGFLLITGKQHAALLVLVSTGGGMLLSSALKEFFERPRPDLVPHVVHVYTMSFPSGHATLSAATYLTLAALLARVQPMRLIKLYLIGVAVVLTLLIGASRVYLGVHWPTDVLAGWAVGAAWAMLCWIVALWLQRRGKVEASGSGRTVT